MSNQPISASYCGLAVISDGVTESTHDIEVHATTGENAATSAWHIIIKGRVGRDLGYPLGKPVDIALPDGDHCAGVLVDPQLIRGRGAPPC